MICPSCSSNNVYCIDSRDSEGNKRRRRLKCMDCEHRFTTIEIIVDTDILKALHKDDLKETIRLANLAKKFANEVKEN